MSRPGTPASPDMLDRDGGEENRAAAKPKELVSLDGVISGVEVYEAAAGLLERPAGAARVRRIREHGRGVDAVTGLPYVAGEPALLRMRRARLS